MRLNHSFVGNHIFTSCLSVFFSFTLFYLFILVITLFLCAHRTKAEREQKRWSYHHLQQLVPAQRKVVKVECRIFDELHKWSAKSASFCSLIPARSMNTQCQGKKSNIPKSGKAAAEITCKIANCGNLELFPEIKPITREIICFHLRRHAIQFEVAHARCTSFPISHWSRGTEHPQKKRCGSPKYRIKRHIMLRIRLEWKISAALSGYSPKSLTNISSQLAFPVANAHRETGRNQTAESYMGMISW